MNDYFMRIYYVIQKFQLDMYLMHFADCIETSAFIKYNFKTHGKIQDILKYENEFRSALNDKIWLESKNGYISICIPKDKADCYPINEILDSEFYQNYTGPLKIALGENVDGEMAIGDLEKWINVLIAGVPGSGKSNLLNVIVNCLIQQSTELVNLIIFDLKKVELTQYNHIPHLQKPVITSVSDSRKELMTLISEMLRRYDRLEDAGVKNIQIYNKKHGTMPYLVVIIDELSVLMLDDRKEVIETQLVKLASLGRAAGIHLVLATQKPSSDIITSKIKSNIDTRISFRVTNHYDSQVIIDQSGAEKLRMEGDMLLRDRDGLERIQCCNITDDEIEDNINRYQDMQFGKVDLPNNDQLQLDYVDAKFVEVEEETEFDRLYNVAVDYVKENKECNQWQLRNHLHKGPRFVDKILNRMIDQEIISKYKIGNNYGILRSDF